MPPPPPSRHAFARRSLAPPPGSSGGGKRKRKPRANRMPRMSASETVSRLAARIHHQAANNGTTLLPHRVGLAPGDEPLHVSDLYKHA
eukprot:4567023-Prorocentrum_lima.AAC.1